MRRTERPNKPSSSCILAYLSSITCTGLDIGQTLLEILGCHRQSIDEAGYLQRIVYRGGDRRTCGIDAGFARALDAEGVEGRRRVLANEYFNRRHLGRCDHKIIRQ